MEGLKATATDIDENSEMPVPCCALASNMIGSRKILAGIISHPLVQRASQLNAMLSPHSFVSVICEVDFDCFGGYTS